MDFPILNIKPHLVHLPCFRSLHTSKHHDESFSPRTYSANRLDQLQYPYCFFYLYVIQ